MQKFLLFIENVKWQTWVLSFLILLGVFLRTYKFQDWLLFGDDQIRDAYITSDVVTNKAPIPLTGPFMSYSGDGAHSEADSFHMGPIYYYFQMFSAKIFGNYPDKLAYPDVFFSILSIPLLFFFLKSYFSENLSLGITGVYAISSYFINYSRFAWNTNPIPFFILLFLLSLYKFLEKNEKVNWGWVLSLGFAIGIGFQLHAITMILFSVVVFIVFLVSLKRNPNAWKKWVGVLTVFLVLNISQIISEIQTNFNNTKTLIHSATSSSNGTPSVQSVNFSRLANDLDCHVESNFFFLSSYGNGRCSHDFVTAPANGWMNHYFKDFRGNIRFAILLLSLFFSVAGYLYLAYSSKNEKDASKKHFLQLISLYATIGFLIMLPLSQSSINEMRYFVFGFFVPLVFLGFLLASISRKIKNITYVLPIVMLIFALLIVSNMQALSVSAKPFLANRVTCSSMYKTTLGELEPVVNYMISHSDDQKTIYLEKDTSHRVMSDALTYLLNRQGFNVVKLTAENYPVSSGSPRFYVSCKMPKTLPVNTTLRVDDVNFDQKIGQIYIYQLESNEAMPISE